MKYLYLLALSIVVAASSARSQTTLSDSFQCDGVYRSFRLYIPANYAAAAQHPLILNMHGLGSNAFEQQYYSDFMHIADTAQFLMAYPQGLSYAGTTYWNCGNPLAPPTNDVKFISALIDTISKRYVVDAQRVYATGMSLGGYMSYYLALHLNNRIAAIASVAGTMDPSVYATAAPGRAVPVMQVHGTADGTVPYTGNGVGIHIDTLVAFWVKNDGCNPTPAHTNLPDINTTDNCTAEHFVWSGGNGGATCEFYKITGGDHTWPGSPINIGTTNQDFSASAEIWRFFRGYRLSQFLAVKDVAVPTVSVALSPNPAGNVLHIEAGVSGSSTIYSINGQRLLETSARDIDVCHLRPGIYFLCYKTEMSTEMTRFVKD